MDLKYEIVDLNNKPGENVPNGGFGCANFCPNGICLPDFMCSCDPGIDCYPNPNPGCTYPDLNCGADSIRPDR